MTDPRLLPFIPPAQASHAKFYPRGPFTSIILAQGIIESAWFTEPSGRNNYFGIKATGQQIATNKATLRWTHETINGQYKKLPQWFANYPTIGAGFDAHSALLTTPHYQRCAAAGNPKSYAIALQLCGYATGIPSHPYDKALIDLMDTYNLYQYDTPVLDGGSI